MNTIEIKPTFEEWLIIFWKKAATHHWKIHELLAELAGRELKRHFDNHEIPDQVLDDLELPF